MVPNIDAETARLQVCAIPSNMAILGCPLLLLFLAEAIEPRNNKKILWKQQLLRSLNATKGTMLKNCVHLYNSLPKPCHRSEVQTEQQHRFDGGIMQLTEPWEHQFSCFHWKASQQRKTRLHSTCQV